MSKALQIIRGSDVTIPFTIAGLNLTGMTVYFTAKPTSSLDSTDPSDGTAIIKASTASHTDAANGVTSISLLGSASQGTNTSQLVPGDYDYDIWTKDSGGSWICRTNGAQKLTVLSAVKQSRS